jgi:hypothetical protein
MPLFGERNNDGTVWKEATIRIGTADLTFAQSMSIRVAVSNMLLQLQDAEYRKSLGPVAEGYENRLHEVLKLLLAAAR